jgi:hypothetical protein
LDNPSVTPRPNLSDGLLAEVGGKVLHFPNTGVDLVNGVILALKIDFTLSVLN